MDFAPYQDTPPDLQRTLSPSPPPRRALSRSPPAQTQQSYQKPSYQQHQQQSSSSHLPLPSHFGADVEPNNSVYANNNINNNNNINSSRLTGRSHINLFETSLPIRLDYEAVAAYILLPPAGAVILLLLEHKSDYVRFHAWQSAILFTGTFLLHLIFSFSVVVSWILLVVDVALIGVLGWKAYYDADNLDRFEIPYIGRLASNWVDAE